MLSVTISKENRVNFKYGQWSWNLEVTDQQRENLTVHMLRLGAKWSFHGSTALLMIRYTPTDFEPMNDEDVHCNCVLAQASQALRGAGPTTNGDRND